MAALAAATPEELELKQRVTDSLARGGVLAKIKAELRAAVFRVLHEGEGPVVDASTRKLSAFPVDVAATAVELIAECLAFFQWDHSLLVLRAEADLEASPTVVDGEKLAQKLRLDADEVGETSSKPVLLRLVEERLAGKAVGGRGSWKQETSAVGGDRAVEPVAWRDELRREEHLEMEEEAEEAEAMEEMEEAERGVEQRLDAVSDRQVNDLAAESEEDEGDRGGVLVREEEPRGGAGKFVQPAADDNRSDGQEESATANQPGQDASRHEDEDQEEEDEDEELESELELEESLAEDIASGSEYEESRELASPVPSAKQPADGEDSDAGDREDARAMLPPPVPTRLAPSHPIESLAPPPTAVDHEPDANARDEESDADDEAARLSSLDAKLKAMEAEDDTGTLQQLKASLQLELQREDGDGDGDGKSEADEDGDGYGSSDFEEEEVASEVSEEVESMVEAEDEEDAEGDANSDRELSVPMPAAAAVPAVLLDDRAVESEDALNSYDHVEPVERPW